MTMGIMLVNMKTLNRPSVWKLWVEHLMKKQKTLSLCTAALVNETGVTAAATPGFIIPAKDVQKLRSYFQEGDNKETLSIRGKTYIIKSRQDRQIIAFNGTIYLIISQSRNMYIVATCDSRSTHEEAASWIRRINKHLIEKGF